MLTVCAYIVGGIRSILPRALWFAFQENVHYRTSETVIGGSIIFDTNIAHASICGKMNIEVLVVTMSTLLQQVLVRKYFILFLKLFIIFLIASYLWINDICNRSKNIMELASNIIIARKETYIE